MQVSNPNNVKIYNLSAGKSLPDWISHKKKRGLLKKDPELRRRIELVQDFDMPLVSNCISMSKDGQYIFATGSYKPRMKCFESTQLSMKFERCLDSEIVKMTTLLDDYTKLVYLLDDRYVEFHSQGGKYYKTRIPKFGRDMSYHYSSCDLYIVGAGSEVYRLNLEQGRFMNSLKTNATEVLCCEFNPVHDLFTCGTLGGHLECWDPRSRNRVATLDCALGSITDMSEFDDVPAVTSLKYRDGLQLAVGTSTGQILVYDVRSDKPLLVKDHNYGLPIKKVEFHDSQNLVLSMDQRILKMWDRNTGKAFTAIESEHKLNDLCVVPSTGLLFMANDAPKMQTYYIPALGPAPKWAHFLDSLTEELEETPEPTVYDDYKFVTKQELDTLGMANLIGSDLLRAYMHGYFMDNRLYHKAKSIANPFAYEEYRKSKIKQKIEEQRSNRVKVQKLPKVNKLLASRLMEQEEDTDTKKKTVKKAKEAASLLKDDRFASIFSNPDFQVDTEAEEYRLLNPLVNKMDKERAKRIEKQTLKSQFKEVEGEDDEEEGRPSSEEDSSDDDKSWEADVKKQHRLLAMEAKARRREEAEASRGQPKFYELKPGEDMKGFKDDSVKRKQKLAKRSFGDRLKEQETSSVRQYGPARGNMEISFERKEKKSEREKKRTEEARLHHSERRKLRRSAHDITGKTKTAPKFWMGSRVK